MKTEYVCEKCGKRFSEQHHAKLCEQKHNLDSKRDEVKAQSIETIGKMIDRHIATFKEMPVFKISDESMKILEKNSCNGLSDYFDRFIEMFF